MNKHEAPIARGRLHDVDSPTTARPSMSRARADYIDDMVEPAGTLHAYLGAVSTRAHAEIVSIDLAAVRAAPGVVGVLTADDIPGENDVSPPHKHDEPVFAHRHGPVLRPADVRGDRRDARPRAPRRQLAKIEYRDLPAILDVDAARDAGGKLVTEPLKLERGDRRGRLRQRRQHRLKGTMRDRRAGPLLSRGPDRARDPRRGRGRHRLVLDPASERSAAHGRAGARHRASTR